MSAGSTSRRRRRFTPLFKEAETSWLVKLKTMFQREQVKELLILLFEESDRWECSNMKTRALQTT